METKRQELIDFMQWVINEDGMTTNEQPTSPELYVDEYLKSINSAPSESRNVATHEAKRKFCWNCGSDIEYTSHGLHGYRCSICGAIETAK